MSALFSRGRIIAVIGVIEILFGIDECPGCRRDVQARKQNAHEADADTDHAAPQCHRGDVAVADR